MGVHEEHVTLFLITQSMSLFGCHWLPFFDSNLDVIHAWWPTSIATSKKHIDLHVPTCEQMASVQYMYNWMRTWNGIPVCIGMSQEAFGPLLFYAQCWKLEIHVVCQEPEHLVVFLQCQTRSGMLSTCSHMTYYMYVPIHVERWPIDTWACLDAYHGTCTCMPNYIINIGAWDTNLEGCYHTFIMLLNTTGTCMQESVNMKTMANNFTFLIIFNCVLLCVDLCVCLLTEKMGILCFP